MTNDKKILKKAKEISGLKTCLEDLTEYFAPDWSMEGKCELVDLKINKAAQAAAYIIKEMKWCHLSSHPQYQPNETVYSYIIGAFNKGKNKYRKVLVSDEYGNKVKDGWNELWDTEIKDFKIKDGQLEVKVKSGEAEETFNFYKQGGK